VAEDDFARRTAGVPTASDTSLGHAPDRWTIDRETHRRGRVRRAVTGV
jgi:hypothetical protein